MIRLRVVGLATAALVLGTAVVAAGVGCTSTSGAGGTTSVPEAGPTGEAGGVDGGAGDAGAGDTGAPGDAQAPLLPGADASIAAFNQALICFGDTGDGGPSCSRTVDQQVTFPTAGTFGRIVMHVTLDCPAASAGGCDHWDRVGSIDLVTEGASTEAGTLETLTELGRFVTPFDIVTGVNSPPEWDIDVTELRPLLSGTVTLRAFIDTWVPQGDPADNGGGWVLSATFEMTGGTPAKTPVVVVPIWTWTTTGKEPTGVPFGDPSTPIDVSVPPQTIQLPSGPTSWGVRSTITGHGQANLDDCAEFCSKNHTWTVGNTANTAAMWRTDCSSYPSSGSYTYSRGGWCPGSLVIPWDFDVTSQVSPGSATTIAYGVESYVNTCNGNAPEDAGLCTACAAQGVSCPYNGGTHTPPFYYVQGLLIGFR